MAFHLPGPCAFARAVCVSAVSLALGSCDVGTIVGDPSAAQRGGVIGSLADGAPDSLTGPGFLGETAQQGRASSLRLVEARWGRAVDLYALDPLLGEPRLVLEDLVVDPTELGQLGDVTLEPEMLGAGERLTVLHEPGTPAFERVLERLQAGRVPLGATGPQLDTVPRNAALELVFDDLLDPQSLDEQAVSLLVDGAPVQVEPVPSRSHGAVVDGERRSARVVLHLTSCLAGTPDAQVLLVLALRGSTVLTNLSGHPLTVPDAAPALVLPFRAGGSQGLLADTSPPFVVGALPGQVTSVAPGADPRTFAVDFLFDATSCAFAPQRRDALVTPTHAAEVLGAGAPSMGGATVRMRVRLRSGDPATFAPGAALLRARWTSTVSAPPECFVTFLPLPSKPPGVGVGTASTVRIAFSEPMDPASVRALDTFRLAYGQPAQPGPLGEHVVGSILPSPNLRESTFQPALPLRHVAGTAERYEVELRGGPQGVRDLAGNPLGFDLPAGTFLIDAAEPTQASASLSLAFAAVDEDGDGAPEVRGQMLYDLTAGTIRGRPVAHFSAVADPVHPVFGAMIPYAAPLQTPLNPLGAKLMSVWRYVDLGMTLLDESYHNLDVEGLNWSPFGGSVNSDHFGQFRMALAHAAFLPDEVIDVNLLPLYKLSGLVPTYDDDLSDPTGDPLTVVHDKAMGYTVDPADLFLASSGTPMMPWPMNRNVPVSQFVYWTWRDTAKLALGGELGTGADPGRLNQILPSLALVGFYPAGQVPTLALPLLTEYRCYPDDMALGLNGFQTSLALNSSYKPTFRAYSAGGVSSSGTKIVDPDSEPVATGGVDPLTGASTLPIDNVSYWGQADFVVRVSRAHTRWLDTGAPKQALLSVLESHLPPGTEVRLAFRGATSLTASSGAPWLDAGNLGPYGDPYTTAQLILLGLPTSGTFSVQYFPVAGSPRWHDDVAELAGARYLQARISFVAEPAGGAVPSLDGLGVTWLE